MVSTQDTNENIDKAGWQSTDGGKKAALCFVCVKKVTTTGRE